MSACEWIFTISNGVLVLVPVIFIVHEVYDDGLWGRVGLAGVASMSAMVLLETFFGGGYHIDPEIALLVLSFAVFITWHLIRFHRRILRQRREGVLLQPYQQGRIRRVV